MHCIFNLPDNLNIEFFEGDLFVTPPRIPNCQCKGRLHIHEKRVQAIKHSYTFESGVVMIHLLIRTYRCSCCKHQFTCDGQLGVQKGTTQNFRHIAVEYAEATSFQKAALKFSTPKSTIWHWRKNI